MCNLKLPCFKYLREHWTQNMLLSMITLNKFDTLRLCYTVLWDFHVCGVEVKEDLFVIAWLLVEGSKFLFIAFPNLFFLLYTMCIFPLNRHVLVVVTISSLLVLPYLVIKTRPPLVQWRLHVETWCQKKSAFYVEHVRSNGQKRCQRKVDAVPFCPLYLIFTVIRTSKV